MDLYYRHRDKIGHLRGTLGPVGGVASGVQAVRGNRVCTSTARRVLRCLSDTLKMWEGIVGYLLEVSWPLTLWGPAVAAN